MIATGGAARVSPLFLFYSGAALVGAIVPYAILIPWVRDQGGDPAAFLSLPFATPPAALFSSDLLIAAGVFLVFAWVEESRSRVPRWIAPITTVLFGLCCALPLFLAVRQWRAAA